MDVQLDPDLERFIVRQVESGRFAAPNEVICHALLLMSDGMGDVIPLTDEQRAELHRRLEAYRLDGERGRPAEEVFEEIRQRL